MKRPDAAFTYETQFDWVRVFQKDVATGLKDLKDLKDPKDPKDLKDPKDPKDLKDSWFTLDGRKLQAEPTRPGIYIHGRRKVAVK